MEFADSVWILDYKSDAKATPQNIAQCAAPYLNQLREYRAAMRAVYPDKPVRCALVFGGALFYEAVDQAVAE